MPSEERDVEVSRSSHKRASDADRQEIAQLLLTAADEGRLELSEYDERLRRTHQAKTYAELDTVVADLPDATPSYRARRRDVKRPKKPRTTMEKLRGVKSTWIGLGSATIFFTGIWAIPWLAGGGGSPPYYWPAWVVGLWSLGALIHTFRVLTDD